MNDVRRTPAIDSPGPLRAQRAEAAAVAQYIHELSDRRGGPAHTGDPRAETGGEHPTEPRDG